VEEPSFLDKLMDRFFDQEITDEIPDPGDIVVADTLINPKIPFLGTIVPGSSDDVIHEGDQLTYEADVSLDESASGCSLYPDTVTMDTWLKVGAIHYTSSTVETVDIPCEGSVSLSKDFPAPGLDVGNREQDYTVELYIGDADSVGFVGDVEDGIVADSDTLTVYEEIDPPTASIDAPSTVKVGESVSLDASSSSGEELSYSWSIDGSSESGESVSTSFSSEGRYSLQLTVSDWQGQTDTASTTVRAEYEEVDASIDVAGSSKVGEEVEFDGEFSQGHDGITSYTWRINGDRVSSSSSFTRTFEEPGEYTVELTVEDGVGQQDTTTETHTVSASKPTASFSVPSSVEAGETVTLDASQSSKGSYPIEEYRWNVAGETLTGESVSTSFSQDGEKQIELTVVDSQGNTATESAMILVTSEGPQPAISVQADRLVVGEEITFSGEDSEPGSSEINSYQWSINGEPASGSSTSIVFEEPGNKTIELSVTDTQGRENTVSRTVEIIEDGGSDTGDSGTGDSDSDDDSGGNGSGDENDDEEGEQGFFRQLWDSIWRVLTFQ